MEDLMGKAAIYGGMVLALVAALKGMIPWFSGWRTLLPTIALSAASAWYCGSVNEPPLELAQAVMLFVMIVGVAVGAWTGITKIGTGSLPTMKTNTPNGNP